MKNAFKRWVFVLMLFMLAVAGMVLTSCTNSSASEQGSGGSLSSASVSTDASDAAESDADETAGGLKPAIFETGNQY